MDNNDKKPAVVIPFPGVKRPQPLEPSEGHQEDESVQEFGSEPSYFPSPSDFEPAPPVEKGPLSRPPDLTTARPALYCFAFFIMMSVVYWNHPAGQYLWVSRSTVLVEHELWRLFTALFTHADPGHLLANTPLFLIFGWFLRAFFGFWVFPVLALVLGAATNLLTIYYYPPTTRLVGASGMLYAMVSLWLVLYMRFDQDRSVPMRFARALAFSLVCMFPTTLTERTSYLSHAVGFGLGLLAGAAIIPWTRVRDPRKLEHF